MIGAMLDLTDRQAGTEAALADNEERLRLATDAAEVGFWDVDVVRDRSDLAAACEGHVRHIG